jgi:hypothetical protein
VDDEYRIAKMKEEAITSNELRAISFGNDGPLSDVRFGICPSPFPKLSGANNRAPGMTVNLAMYRVASNTYNHIHFPLSQTYGISSWSFNLVYILIHLVCVFPLVDFLLTAASPKHRWALIDERPLRRFLIANISDSHAGLCALLHTCSQDGPDEVGMCDERWWH